MQQVPKTFAPPFRNNNNTERQSLSSYNWNRSSYSIRYTIFLVYSQLLWRNKERMYNKASHARCKSVDVLGGRCSYLCQKTPASFPLLSSIRDMQARTPLLDEYVRKFYGDYKLVAAWRCHYYNLFMCYTFYWVLCRMRDKTPHKTCYWKG